MSPTILRVGQFRFFFNSREESRPHVHIAAPDGVAKFWLEPIVALASHYGVSKIELKKMEGIVKEMEDDFKSAWNNHFSK